MVDALLMLLAVARVTRMVTTDTITQSLRTRVIDTFGERSNVTYLVFCSWCSSVYVGAVGGAAWWMWHGSSALTAVTLALGASYAAGFLNSKADD